MEQSPPITTQDYLNSKERKELEEDMMEHFLIKEEEL